ncbi:MAG: NUDIX hydrolase [Candidatus Korarchaeum sp.]|nr:NUDIX hydrolase [Candidatus Korarchaeum sp.]
MREFPRYAIASVGAVLLREGKLLLVRRGFPPGQGKWSIPGGVIEAGESILEAVKRELFEETNLSAEPIGLIALSQVVVSDDSRVKYHYVIADIIFDPASIEGSERPGGDATDVSWLSLEEASTRDDVTRTTRKLASLLRKGVKYLPIDYIL